MQFPDLAVCDKPFRIWIDADACPTAVKEILLKTSNRLEIDLVFVANQTVRVPKSKFVQIMTVRDGANLADKKIIEMMAAGDVVITGDIPLAAEVVQKDGIAIGTRGELFEDGTIEGRLASRNLMEHLRSAGMETRGPKAFDAKDLQQFANQLDRTLTRILRKKN